MRRCCSQFPPVATELAAPTCAAAALLGAAARAAPAELVGPARTRRHLLTVLAHAAAAELVAIQQGGPGGRAPPPVPRASSSVSP